MSVLADNVIFILQYPFFPIFGKEGVHFIIFQLNSDYDMGLRHSIFTFLYNFKILKLLKIAKMLVEIFNIIFLCYFVVIIKNLL